jgi:hypothetical protein
MTRSEERGMEETDQRRLYLFSWTPYAGDFDREFWRNRPVFGLTDYLGVIRAVWVVRARDGA